VLCALRLDPATSSGQTYPAAHEYLSHFVQRDWFIESLLLLAAPANARDLYLRFGAPIASYDRNAAGNQEINLMVGAARNHFGWA
jgi:hypothetical protein